MTNNAQKDQNKERSIVINIRKKIIRTPLYKRSKKSINLIREIIKRISKKKDIKISCRLNEYIWSRGIKNPPKKINIKIIEKETRVYVDLDEKK